MTRDEFQALLASPEGRRVEFKEAKGNFHFDELAKYCVALANEGGGKVILGVTNARPREAVGTAAFKEPGRTEAGLFDELSQHIPVEEYLHDDRRVLVVDVPSRLPGRAWNYKGSYLMRAGDSLLPMSDDRLQGIHAETGPDFSAEICDEARLADLDPNAIEVLRGLWQRKSPAQGIENRSVDHLLGDAELVFGDSVTYAALILLGTREALGRHLGHAEIVFEYRSSEAPGPAAERREFRAGCLPVLDEVWRRISLRNDRQHFQQGLLVLDVPTFDERAVREAVLNAVSHRDYRHTGSVFVRQYSRRIEIVSPGGFPPGITPDNALWQQNPRNRRIAEVLGKCGLVERSGQGFDLMYRECIRQGKRLPDFTNTGEQSVWVTLHGEIQDPEFLRFLEEIGNQRLAAFGTEDFLIVDMVRRGDPVPPSYRQRTENLIELGILERTGRGRGSRLLLSRRLYRRLGRGGTYTRTRGLDRETNKALLVKHIQDNESVGTQMGELKQVLPALARSQIQVLLRDLVKEGAVHVRGRTRAARWYAGPAQPDKDHSGDKLQ